MATYLTQYQGAAIDVMEFIGASTDSKPTETYEGLEIPPTSRFLEYDTGTLYLYVDGAWVAI